MLADLEERFHENTARRNLSAFEELISIGTLAAQFPDLTQSQIAARLGVVQADVSLGIACLYHRKKLEKEIDTVTASKRYFRSLLPKLKRGDPLGPCPCAPDLKPDTQMWDVRGIVMQTAVGQLDTAIKINRARIDLIDLEAMLVDLARVVMRYQIKKK
ncbi:MAG: hypothetical protein AAFQ32_00635 [Pseudomonadota bacterium]